jgi:hypothetical protein
MKLEHQVRLLAGSMLLLSLALTHLVSPWWGLLTVFVGVNLIQSAFTGFCPAEKILLGLGIAKEGGKCCR